MVGEGGGGEVMQQQEQQQPKTLQLVSGIGDFNESGLGDFAKQIDLFSHGLSYAVVAIMGPQSSGKSTLMNHLFGTRFTEMDALKGRRQTTQGIWMAKAAVDLQPLTLVMDLEGTDGRERGEDDTAFEKQSALFALAVADVILVNMWCHDIGREQAANKPLLKTVFQVMMRLFSPRKATLLFVIRDKTKTPLETLEPILREDIQRIWDSLPKPEEHKTTPLSEFFNVEVTWLPNYEEKEEEFVQRVAMMRERFQNSTAPGGIAGNRATVVPATGLPLSLETMWKVIRDNKDLDLPAHKVMVATVRCEQIADEKLHQFQSSEDWAAVVGASESGVVVADFGSRVGTHVALLLSKYDDEAGFFEESVRTNKRQHLVTQLKEVVKPAHAATMEHIARKSVDAFKKALDEATGGDGTSAAKFADACRRCTDDALSAFDAAAAGAEVTVLGLGVGKSRDAFAAEVAKHADEVRQTKLKKIASDAEEFLERALGGPVAALLDAGTKDTWADIRDVYWREVASATEDLRSALAGFEMEEEDADKFVKELEGKARKVVEEKTKQMAQHALTYMKERFLSVFSYDNNSMPRRWTAKDDIAAITKTARLASLTLMAAVAAVRLDEEPLGDPVLPLLQPLLQQEGAAEGGGEADAFGSIGSGSSSISGAPDTGVMSASTSLASASVASTVATSASLSRSVSKLGGSSRRGVLLAARQWDEIPDAATLLTPQECVQLWRKLILETRVNVEQAQMAQDASSGSSWLPPPWAIVAIITLGFNEFMALLRNPLLLLLLVTLYLFGRAMWKQLEVERHFQHGVLPGLIAVSANVVPAVLRILQQLAEAGQHAVADATAAHQQAQQQQQRPDYADRHPQPTTWNYADGGDGSNGSSSIASGSVGGGSSLRHRSVGGGAEERD